MYYIYTFLKLLTNWIFPESPDIHELTHLIPHEFLQRVSYSLDSPHPNIYSLFNYRDLLVQRAIWELKYRGNREIARLLAPILYDFITEICADKALFSHFTQPLLIPIPLSKERLQERGWNQTEMLAHRLQKYDKNKFFTVETKLLAKIKHTKPQTTLTKSERLKNLHGCFEILGKEISDKNGDYIRNREKIKNRNIILLDDVTTTGSTLLEAAETLRRAGAREVIACTLAH